MIKVPNISDSNVLKILKLIRLDSSPVKVIYKPENFCKKNFCFPNIDQKIKRDGGQIVYGWQLWEHDFMIEAEFHAVWKSPQGNMLDITPKQMSEDHIVFVEDLKMKYEDKQVDNFRIKTIDNALVDDYIELWKAKYRLLNKAGREEQQIVMLSGGDVEMYEGIEGLIFIIKSMLLKNQNQNSPCFCDSGRTFYNCHRNDIMSLIDTI